MELEFDLTDLFFEKHGHYRECYTVTINGKKKKRCRSELRGHYYGPITRSSVPSKSPSPTNNSTNGGGNGGGIGGMMGGSGGTD